MWQDTWNFFRHHYGKGMTHCEKLRSKGMMITDHILRFPVILLEELMKQINLPNKSLTPTHKRKW